MMLDQQQPYPPDSMAPATTPTIAASNNVTNHRAVTSMPIMDSSIAPSRPIKRKDIPSSSSFSQCRPKRQRRQRQRHRMVSDIIERIQRNDSVYTEFSIRHIPYEYVTYEDIEDIMEALQQNTSIRQVEIWLPPPPTTTTVVTWQEDGDVGDGYFYPCFIECLSYNTHIEQLCILSVPNDIAWQSLCIGLCYNQSIQEFILGNDDEDDTMMSSSSSSSVSGDLINDDTDNRQQQQQLSLSTMGTTTSNMKFNHIACQSIQRILSTTKSLRSLMIRNGTIPSLGMKIIARGLHDHIQRYDTMTQFEWQQIEILYDDVDDGGFDPIFLAMAKSNHIRTFHIIDCNLTTTSSRNRVSGSSSASSASSASALEYLLRTTKSLQTLRFIQCQLSSSDTLWNSLCYGMAYNTSIHTLDVSHNDISDGIQLGKMLYYNGTVQKLILEHNHFHDLAMHQLCYYGLQYNTSLQHVNVKSNKITGTGCQALGYIFPTISPKQHCSSNHNGNTTSSKLHTLLLSYNDIGNVGGNLLGMIFQSHPYQFQHIEIEGCSITDDGIYDLCHGLLSTSLVQQQPQSPSRTLMNAMHTLNMSQNIIGEKGAIAISKMLSCHSIAIQSLHLRSCALTDRCVEMITQGIINKKFNCQNDTHIIRKRHALKELMISFNHIDNDGAKAISHMIQHGHCYMEILNVQYNDFDRIGMNDIMNGLRHNYYIKELLIWNCNCDTTHHDDWEEIHHRIRLNSSGRCMIPMTTLNDHHVVQHRHHETTTTTTTTIATSTWPTLLAHANREYGAKAIFHLLTEMPHMMTVRL